MPTPCHGYRMRPEEPDAIHEQVIEIKRVIYPKGALIRFVDLEYYILNVGLY